MDLNFVAIKVGSPVIQLGIRAATVSAQAGLPNSQVLQEKLSQYLMPTLVVLGLNKQVICLLYYN